MEEVKTTSAVAQPVVPANQRQVGGAHYAAAVQHWDLVAALGLGYFEGQITKYLTRYKKKAGRQDVEKAIHYYDKLLELYAANKLPWPERYPTTGWARTKLLDTFVRENGLSSDERVIFNALCGYRNMEELAAVRPLLVRVLATAPDAVHPVTARAETITYCAHGYSNRGNCAACRLEATK